MKNFILAGAALAAILAACGGSTSSPRTQLAASSTAVPISSTMLAAVSATVPLPALFAKAAVARAAPPDPKSAAAFTVDGLEFLPLGIQMTANDGDWWVQCVRYPDGHTACARIIEAEQMRGLEVRTALANDGRTPLTFFAQTLTPATPEEADRQSLMIGVFNQRYGQAIASLRAGGNNARAPGSSSTKAKAKPGSDADPDPGPHMQTVEVPGTRPDPEYPPPYDPPPAPDTSPPPDTGNGGSGDGVPEQPDGSGWKRLKAPGQACVALPGPGGAPIVGCAVVIPPPAQDPDSLPPSVPPGWDWCAHGSICNATNAPPPDPRYTACASKFIVDAAVCIRDRATGKITRDKELQCLDTKYADLAKCRATLGNVVVPGGQ